MLCPSPRQRAPDVLAGALLLDVMCGEPPATLHPVVWIGRLIAALEHRAPRTAVAQVLYGAGVALAVPTVAVGMACAGESVTAALARRSGWPGVADVVAAALVLKPAFAARMLLDAGQVVERALDRADLDAARAGLHALVSRDVSALGPGLLAAAMLAAGRTARRRPA
jgi:adenosylcobinamide-phosphate synthase